MGVVIVSQRRCSRQDTDSCARTHAQLNASAVTAHVYAQLNLACTREISSKSMAALVTTVNVKNIFLLIDS